MKITTKILLLFLTLITLNIHGQNRNQDSIIVAKTVNDFYDWYIQSNKYDKNEENRPAFIIDSSDTVRLDFTKYLANLKKYKFSDTLINREKLDYKSCENNLKNITREEFLSFDDIDDYENIGCDFDNSYKWIGGQELCDGIIINNQSFQDKTLCRVELEYFSINGVEKSYWRNKITVSLTKIHNEWKITNIEI